MSVEPSHEQFTRWADVALFAVKRCDWLDSFARLENAVCALLRRHDLLDASNKPFSQRLKLLLTLQPSPKLSTQNAKLLPQFVEDCERLLPTRATIVHSVMQTGLRGAEPVAFFHNVAELARDQLNCLVMSSSDLDELQSVIRKLEERATSMTLNRPSQPPPEPAAAAGP